MPGADKVLNLVVLCREQMTYKVSAIAASAGMCTAAIVAVYVRFSLVMQDSGTHKFPASEAIATLLLTLGGVVWPYLLSFLEVAASSGLTVCLVCTADCPDFVHMNQMAAALSAGPLSACLVVSH